MLIATRWGYISSICPQLPLPSHPLYALHCLPLVQASSVISPQQVGNFPPWGSYNDCVSNGFWALYGNIQLATVLGPATAAKMVAVELPDMDHNTVKYTVSQKTRKL